MPFGAQQTPHDRNVKVGGTPGGGRAKLAATLGLLACLIKLLVHRGLSEVQECMLRMVRVLIVSEHGLALPGLHRIVEAAYGAHEHNGSIAAGFWYILGNLGVRDERVVLFKVVYGALAGRVGLGSLGQVIKRVGIERLVRDAQMF